MVAVDIVNMNGLIKNKRQSCESLFIIALCWSFKSQTLTVKLRSKPDVGVFSMSDYSLCPECAHHWPGLPWWRKLRVFTPLKMERKKKKSSRHGRSSLWNARHARMTQT